LRAEEKDLDGADLARETERQRESELEKEDEAELPELQSEAAHDTEHSAEVIGIMRAILDRQHVVVDQQQLPARELKALEALQAAVEGKDAKLSQFVFASDRRDLLEQALAVLQPNFVTGDEQHATLLGAYGDLIERVGLLRTGLVELEDAQDDLLMAKTAAAVIKTDADQDDKPDADASLTGPERTPDPKQPSTLAGPELKAEPKPASTLTGPDVKPEPKPASSLTGPEAKPEPAKPSSLGDEKDLAEAQKKPWWKRVLG
jgi:hypothetical protein